MRTIADKSGKGTGTPRGVDIMRTLITLFAEQEGVTIKYIIEQRGERLEGSTE